MSSSSTSSESSFSSNSDPVTVDGPKGVGLSDPQHTASRRRMLDVVNALHLTGVQVDIDLPVIAVTGSQSSGKSSLIESISGVKLPRASGTCTRSPTECRLSYSEEPWKCVVTLRIITDKNGKPLGHPSNIPFGEPIYNKEEVEDRVRRAQRAILNPSLDYEEFLDESNKAVGREISFSSNSVCLQITGPDVEDLSFCDLPGLIASVGSGGSAGDIELVQGLVTSYIKKPSCIVLLTVACETDFHNQGAHQLTKAHDRDGVRTIGVLTKPDRIPLGEEDSWLRYIRNQEESLTNGWFSVKQPDSHALAEGITWEKAREQERQFFTTTPPWNKLDSEYQNHLGTSRLVERLSDVLTAKIAQRLPIIQEELQDLLTATDEQLNKLPKPPSSDALSEVLHLLSTFTKGLSQFLEGTPDEDGLLQSIRPAYESFLGAIRATEPDFRPYERQAAQRNPEAFKHTTPLFLKSEEEVPYVPADDSSAIYIDEVMQRARQSITRELPNHYPFLVVRDYIKEFIKKWQKPAEALFGEVQRILIRHVKKFVAEHFAHYPALQARVHSIVASVISSSADVTLQRLKWFSYLESRPRTLSNFLYSEYQHKFYDHFKASRPKGDVPRATFASRLEEYSDPNSDMYRYMTKVLNGLTEIGLPGQNPADLASLLPPDPYDAAIEIMAGVRAYFQIAYKRFSDNISAAIDYELVLGLDRGQALEQSLRKGLHIGSPDGYERCKEYIQEPRHVAERRAELLKKRERLESARKELADVWL
ncbi:P-loop containing nucleoside triphosphate hydrolase protein [Trametes polyzona]|nr:P-loop containing nucleoside triphosphate hydrolase protein [Trametes polyzona]